MEILMFKQALSIICVILIILCMLVPLKKEGICQKFLGYHKIYAILLLILSLIHGILAGNNLGIISGKIAWMILLILVTTAYLINRDALNWNKIHLILSIIFTIIAILHIYIAIII